MDSEKRHRMTHQRRVILEEVRCLLNHPTADEIYDRVRKRIPRISMGTVYRNLEYLAKAGVISKLEPGLPRMRFDGNTREHCHTVCRRCGKIEDVYIEPTDNTMELLEKVLGRLSRYGIFGHKLEFIGLCKSCRDMESEEETQDDTC